MRSLDDLSRREVLASTTAAGAFGLGAASTGAVLSDVGSFGNNRAAAGKVDLALCWQTADGETCQTEPGETLSLDIGPLAAGESGSGSIKLRLPDGGEANPAWVFGRTGCPSDHCGIYDALELDVWYDLDCDGDRDEGEPPVTVDGTELTGVSLCRLMTVLADGTLFDASPQSAAPTAVSPGDELCLGVSWRVTTDICAPTDARLDFQFHAEQRRHNPDPDVPWEPVDCEVDCTQECDDECYPASFIAFCRSGTGEGEITKKDVQELSWTDDTIRCRLQCSVDMVVIFYGTVFEVFEPDDGDRFEANTLHEITVGDSDDKRTMDSKNGDGLHPSEPCQSSGCGLKYNFELNDGETSHWENTCGGSDE